MTQTSTMKWNGFVTRGKLERMNLIPEISGSGGGENSWGGTTIDLQDC